MKPNPVRRCKTSVAAALVAVLVQFAPVIAPPANADEAGVGSAPSNYDFDAQTRWFAFWYVASTRDHLTFEWRMAVGSDQPIVFSTAHDTGDVPFRCADLAKGVDVSLRVRDASSTVYDGAVGKVLGACPSEDLTAVASASHEPGASDQKITLTLGGTVGGHTLLLADAPVVDWDRARLMVTLHPDGTLDVPIEPEQDAYDSSKWDLGTLPCARLDDHLFAAVEVHATDGSPIARPVQIALPLCSADAPRATSPADEDETATASPRPSTEVTPAPTAPAVSEAERAGPSGTVFLFLLAIPMFLALVMLAGGGRHVRRLRRPRG